MNKSCSLCGVVGRTSTSDGCHCLDTFLEVMTTLQEEQQRIDAEKDKKVEDLGKKMRMRQTMPMPCSECAKCLSPGGLPCDFCISTVIDFGHA